MHRFLMENKDKKAGYIDSICAKTLTNLILQESSLIRIYSKRNR